MPGLDPGIHVLGLGEKEAVDGRVKPGHDARARTIAGIVRSEATKQSSFAAVKLDCFARNDALLPESASSIFRFIAKYRGNHIL
jgi:hypothetical protein